MTEHRAEEDGVSTLTTDAQRFAKRVHPAPNGCHLWTGAIDADGYGTFNVNGKKLAAHIYAYTSEHGDVPPGHELDHLCHNADLACPGDTTCLHRRCVNKAHLEAVTHAVNLQRRHERAALIAYNDTTSSVSVDTKSLEVKPKRTFGRPFQPGNTYGHGYGRPRKGESVPALLKRAVEKPKTAEAIVVATVERMLRTDSVGNRAFADVRDTVYGLPKQTLVLEQGDSPLAALLERLASRQAPAMIEGEARVIDITPAVDAHSET